MAELDSLQVTLRASASDANKAIDSIVKSLSKLNGALNNFRADSNYMKGLNNLVSGLHELRIHLNGLDPKKIGEVAKAMDSLGKAGEKLAQLNGLEVLANNMEKAEKKVSAVSEKAQAEASRIAKEFNFQDKDGVDKLAREVDHLYASIGDDEEVRRSMENIDNIVKSYARYENVLREVAQAQVDAVRSTHGRLTSDWQDALGGDYETARRNRGRLGIKNTSLSGGSAGSIIGENTSITGVHELENESENLSAALDLLNQNIELARQEFVGFNEVAVTTSGGMEAIRSAADGLVQALGMDAEKMREVSSAANSMDDFMNIDAPDDEFWMLGQRAQESVDPIQNVAKAEENVVKANQEIAQSGNPFQTFLGALQELSGIKLDDSLVNIKFIKESLSKIGGESGSNAATALPFIAQGLRSFDGLKIPQFGDELANLSKGLRALGSGNITNAATALPYITQELRNLSGIKITADIEKIAQLANALARFGYANIEKAVKNMPALAKAVMELANSLSSMPPVSENTIRLMEAMGNMNVHATNASKGTKKLGFSLKNLIGHTNKAQKSTKSLAAAVGKLYASYWILFRLLGKVGKAITLASDLKEVQNVVDVTFGDMADKMNKFAKNAVDTLGMSELTAKQIGSRFQAMGSAMGISDKMVKSTNDFVQAATHGYADVANSMADVSINLTRLAGDMASFYNQDYAEVAERLQAVFTGQTRPLRAYGLDLTNATLQEWAHNHGLEVKIKTLTQAEKTLLRYQYVLAQTTAAQGDFERTIGTWANQIRIATERLKQLGIILGQIAIYTFKPLVTSFNNAMKGIIKSAEGLLNSLGKIFGWQIELDSGGVLQDDEEAAEELADDMGDAADNAKKFKKLLLSIDELNVLQEDKSKDNDKGSGLGKLSGLGDATGGLNIKKTQGAFESLYDTLYKLGRKIADVLKNLLKSIDWETVYKKAERFGKSLAQFFNGLLADAETFYEIGKYFAGGINSFAHMVDAFHKEFDGWQLGVDIGNLINGFTENLDWDVIKRAAVGAAHDLAQTINGAFLTIKWNLLGKTIADGLNTAIDYFYTLGSEIKWSIIGTSIADAINGLFANFDFAKAAKTLSTWVKGFLDTLISLLERTDWDKIGESIGDFIANIDFAGIGIRLAKLLWAAANAAVKAYAGMFNAAPVATAIATAIGLALASKSTFKIVGKGLGKLTNYIGMSLSDDLGRLFTGNIFKTFGAGFKGYFANLDAVGMTGNNIGGIAAGFNAVSASLSNVTKVLGTAVVGFGEFVAVKDSIYDIVAGTDDMGEAFVKLGTSVGIAGVAMSALLGVPTGLIVTGVVAGIGAIAGLISAMDDLREANTIAALTKDMGDAYVSMGDLVLKYKDVTESITGDLDKLAKDYEKIRSIKNDLSEIAGGFDLVVSSITTGNTLTGAAMDELIGNIGEVKSAWEDYINAQYDYLIQSTINDYQFAKSQGPIAEEKEQEYINRIKELTAARESELSGLTDVMEELSQAQWYYNSIVTNAPNPDSVFVKDAEEQLNQALQAVLNFGQASGVAAKGTDQLENSIESLGNLKISFADIDASNYDEMVAEVSGYLTQLDERFQNSNDTIQQTIQDRIDSGYYTEEEAIASMQERVDALNNATLESLDSVQQTLLDRFYTILSTGDYDKATEFATKIVQPLLDSFPTVFDEEGKKVEPYIGTAVQRIIDSAFDVEHDMGILYESLKDDWRDVFWNVKNEVTPDAKQYGKEIVDAMTDGTSEASDATKKVTKSAGDAFEGLGEQVENASNKYEAARKKVKESADAFEQSGDKTKTVRQSIEELSSATGNVVTGFDNMGTSISNTDSMLLEFATQFDTLNLAIIEALPVTGEAFATMFTGIQTDAESLLTWFTETFEPRFTSEYWTTALSGVVTGFSTAFNNAIEAVKGLWNSFAEWAKTNMKITIPKTKMPDGKETEEIDLSVKVGSFYNGGFPESGQLFLARERGAEFVGAIGNHTAVANNDQIIEGIKQGVYEAVAAAWSSNSGNGNVTVEITGDASDIFRAVVRENDRSIMRTGASPIRV